MTYLLSHCPDICCDLGDQYIEILISCWSKVEIIDTLLQYSWMIGLKPHMCSFSQQESHNGLSQKIKCFNLDLSLQSYFKKVI